MAQWSLNQFKYLIEPLGIGSECLQPLCIQPVLNFYLGSAWLGSKAQLFPSSQLGSARLDYFSTWLTWAWLGSICFVIPARLGSKQFELAYPCPDPPPLRCRRHLQPAAGCSQLASHVFRAVVQPVHPASWYSQLVQLVDPASWSQ